MASNPRILVIDDELIVFARVVSGFSKRKA